MSNQMMRVVRDDPPEQVGNPSPMLPPVLVQFVIHCTGFWMGYSETGSVVGGVLGAVFPVEVMIAVMAYSGFYVVMEWAGYG